MALVVVTCAWLSIQISSAEPHPGAKSTLVGVVEGSGARQAGYKVTLYASSVKDKHSEDFLGTDTTDDLGRFEIDYKLPPGHRRHQKTVLYVLAEKDNSMLASAIGDTADIDAIVLNERTTAAFGVAFAQFVDGRKIIGNPYGMHNAVMMAANMANPLTGKLGRVLDNLPNADETSTRATFNTLANIIASCVDDDAQCEELFQQATPIGSPKPSTVLQAIANMTKFPSNHVSAIFELSFINPIYAPALASDEEPTSFLLFIKFTGGEYSIYDKNNLMSGPGNIAFDQRGVAWINDNYIPTRDFEVSCAGQRLLKIFPWGENFPDSPYFGGGLDGAGFGITLDRRGMVWVGNFGFEAPHGACADVAASHNSVSLFNPDGTPISSPAGFTEGHIWWPQATVSDKKRNIWLANCGNDTVTFIPKGKPDLAENFALPGGRGESGNFTPSIPDTEPDSDAPLLKPFGIAIDPEGRAWVTANQAGFDSGSSSEAVGGIYRISSDGTVEALPNLNASNEPVLSWPMGISGDSSGNMWISNSNSVKVPCVDELDPQDGDEGPSITLYPADGGSPSMFTGGGLSIPWGNAVDGNDSLWVFNFGVKPTDIVDENTEWPDTPLSHFCGVDTSKCPAGLSTGDPISPPTGYVSDALDRVTGGNIDPSGNVWLLNNWKKTGPYAPVYDTNPGGNSFVIIPGAAGPVKTPLIGPPTSF